MKKREREGGWGVGQSLKIIIQVFFHMSAGSELGYFDVSNESIIKSSNCISLKLL